MEEVPSLFSTKFKVTLAPKARCTFLATSNAMLEWDPVDDFRVQNQVWTYVLNYSNPDCLLDGGPGVNTVDKAARNVTPGRWLRADKNCAYYVTVGNNMRFPTDEAVFYFSRSSAKWLISGLSVIIGMYMLILM